MVKIGIIGGTGLEKPDLLKNRQEKYVDTPFGKPSDALIIGTIEGVEVVILSRHGRRHDINPTNVNFRANLFALKEEGCTLIVVTTACGSLQEQIKPGDFVVPDQFIDRTTKRIQTFYDGEPDHLKGVCHVPMAEPFCKELREIIAETCCELSLVCHREGTVICIEGPRYSSKAESKLFRSWGADLINMTIVPEVVLAAELALPYASLAIATDYDCWREHDGHVDVTLVMENLRSSSQHACRVLKAAISKIASFDWTKVQQELRKQIEVAVSHPE
ncbi:S-methyl-5'-thioadenosine phosphorylase [Galendromus occidentalis]|uniref:S-methyl-5'-thioadenosine phosphorylase n=1 Tax=Galendromus occidentalis TaxID=34638 RepID=A0AAJ6QKE8_9ACAR|nr:S-methyl-5'-thioadenosine phosphorylase [Galendromus occidentalis]